MDTYIVFVERLDETKGLLVGALPVPPCFRPTDTFLAIVTNLGFIAAIQTAEEIEEVWGRPLLALHISNGQALVEAVRYAQSNLN